MLMISIIAWIPDIKEENLLSYRLSRLWKFTKDELARWVKTRAVP